MKTDGTEPKMTTSEDAQFYKWIRSYAARGLRTGELSKDEIRSLCGAVLELLKRVKIADE